MGGGGNVVMAPVAIFVPVADAGIPSPLTGNILKVYVVFEVILVYTCVMLFTPVIRIPDAGVTDPPTEYVTYALLKLPVHASVVSLDVVAENVGALAWAHV